MKVTTSDNFTYVFTPLPSGMVEVESTPEGIEVMLDTITLTGTTIAPRNGAEGPSGVQVVHTPNGPSQSRLAVLPGTLAMWVQFEMLNYM